MLASAVNVFREALDAALIIAIEFGASRAVAARARKVAGGIAVGIVGACLGALFAGSNVNTVEGPGRELLIAGILLVAVAMFGCHIVWMSAHGRKFAGEMKCLGHDISVGLRPLSAMLIVTTMAVLRDGSESVPFLYGLAGGQVLHVLIGYNHRPSGIQLAFYLVTLTTIAALVRCAGSDRRLARRTIPSTSAIP